MKKIIVTLILFSLSACDNVFKYSRLSGLGGNDQVYTNKYYQHKFSTGMGGWNTSAALKKDTSYIRLSNPYTWLDDNHLQQTGYLQLCLWAYVNGDINGSPILHNPILKNGEVRLHFRGHNFKPHGAEFVFWFASQLNPDRMNEPGWKRANWAYTSKPLTDYLLDGQWHDITIILSSNENDWTFAGNNKKQGNAWRYAYQPLDKSLENANVDILFVLMNVDRDAVPEGSIDIRKITLKYY